MLYLISLGLGGNDVSLKGVEAGKSCEKLYAEFYTTRMNTDIQKLERLFGKKVMVLERRDLEEGSGKLLREAKEKDIGILVGGDVLFATTHLSLVLECKKREITFDIVHGPSILTAVGESGLSLYKFGEIVTVPRWKEHYQPSGFYETILKNKKTGLHSLILLEINMGVREGVEILLRIEKRKKKRLFHGSKKMIAVSKAGAGEQVIWYGRVEELEGEAPAVLILPGRLNAFEREFLDSL